MQLNPASLSPVRTAMILLGIGLVGALTAFWFTLAHIDLTTVQAGGFTNLTRSGAVVNATFTFTNDGLFAVELEQVTYTASLANSTTLLSSGTAAGGVLRTDSPTHIEVQIPLAWEPSAQLAARMLAGGDTTITLAGVATVGAGPFSHDIPFTTTIDARDYLKQFIPQNPNDLLGAALGFFGGN